MSTMVDRVRELALPILADLGLELYDLEYAGGVVRITIDRPGGVDLGAITSVTRMVNRELEHADRLPGEYTLEVSSPGLERTLRTPGHFQGALTTVVAVKTQPFVEGERRLQGILEQVDDDGIVVAGRRLAYTDIDKARTVFEWGGEPKGGRPAKGQPAPVEPDPGQPANGVST
ncbi:MAG: rimP [Acidimicrobiia bacterium]|nr:rimP [Acidimicrobiia bacterium]